jgi:Secretion system C-terminal sorting domain
MKTKHFAFLLLSLSIAFQTAQGQGVVNGGAISANVSSFLHHVTPAPAAPFSSLSSDVAISYFDPSTPTIDFGAPVQIGPYFVPTYGERITLPASGGFLDSVQVTLDTITADSILVYAIPDTLYSTTSGHFHLMNIFDPNVQTPLIGYIHANQVHGRTTVTLAVAHVPISAQNFWIAVEPNFDNISNNFTNAFLISGDSEAVRARTVDNSHSGFLARVNGQLFSAIFDSSFTSLSGAPLYSEFYITAFVDVSGSSVATAPTNSEGLSIFPNPASTSIQIQSGEAISSVDLLDLLGRPVLSQKLGGNGALDVNRLEPGRYLAVVHTAGGIVTAPILIQH